MPHALELRGRAAEPNVLGPGPHVGPLHLSWQRKVRNLRILRFHDSSLRRMVVLLTQLQCRKSLPDVSRGLGYAKYVHVGAGVFVLDEEDEGGARAGQSRAPLSFIWTGSRGISLQKSTPESTKK